MIAIQPTVTETALPVHVIQTGRNMGNETAMREMKWSSQLRRRKPYEFPVFSYIVGHPEGLIAIDTGLTNRVRVPRVQRLMSIPTPMIEPGEEIDSQMRAKGLRTEDVRRVVLTHLDWDHAGGIEHFPNAEILVHRPEHEDLLVRIAVTAFPRVTGNAGVEANGQRLAYYGMANRSGYPGLLYELDLTAAKEVAVRASGLARSLDEYQGKLLEGLQLVDLEERRAH